MGKFRTFFHVLTKSFTSPAYYKELVPQKFGFSLKYFYLFFFFYAVIGTVYFAATAAPGITRFVNTVPGRIQKLYPDELVVTVEKGEVSTNVPEPYAIPLSAVEDAFSADKVLGTNTTQPENLVVIDTNGEVENFTDYNTVVLITRTHVVATDNDGTRLYQLEPDMNFTITKDKVVQTSNQIRPYLGYVVPGLTTLVFLGLFLFVPSGYMIYLLFFALLFLLLAKLLKVNLGYSTLYRLGLHMSTVYAAVFGLLAMAHVSFGVPFLRTILLLVFGYFVLQPMSGSAQASPAEAPKDNPPQNPSPVK